MEAARALPSAYLRSVFNSPEAGNWPKKSLKDVSVIVMGQSPDGNSYNNQERGVPLLNGPTEFGDAYPTPVQWTTSPTRFAQQGDILLCVRGATTGRKNIADKDYCIGRGLAAIRGKNEAATTGFLWFVLDIATTCILKESSGSTFPNLPGEKLENIEIVLPSMAKQNELAAILNEQTASAQKLSAHLENQLSTINKLPAALLRKAFNGEL